MRCSVLLVRALATVAFCSRVVMAQDAPKPAVGALSGRVLMDVSMRPLTQVEVVLPELGITAMSDEKGAFRAVNVPVGYHLVTARRIGYARFEARVQVKAGENSEVLMVLPSVAVLDSLKVVGQSSLPLSYLEHRAAGLGRAIPREELEQKKNIALVNIMSQLSGLGMIRGRGNQGWAISKRYVPSLASVSPTTRGGRVIPPEGMYQPDENETRQGMKLGCYSRVYLDKMLLNSGSPAEPVDLNQYSPVNIEAIEYFASSSQVPAEYNRLNSNCGVIVIHQRRR